MGKDMDNGASQSCNAIHNFWMQQQTHMLPQRKLLNNKAMKHMHVVGHAEKIHNCYIKHLKKKKTAKLINEKVRDPNTTQGSLQRRTVSWD